MAKEKPQPTDLLTAMVFQGWVGIAFWMTFGLLLEGLLGYKIPAYLNDGQRRELFQLAHAHGTLLSVILLIAAAFYAGARYRERIPFLASTVPQQAPVAAPATTPAPEEPFVKFERARRQVDQDPRAWLANDIGKELVASGVQNPLDSPNAEFLYLYGRANLLTGNTDEAGKAFDAAISKADQNPSPANATIKKESILGLSLISVRTQTQKDRWKVLNHYEQMTKPPANSNAP